MPLNKEIETEKKKNNITSITEVDKKKTGEDSV